MADRILARVVTIDSLHPIKGKDRIELALVGGWQVIVQKGLYEPGITKAVYFEVDSLLNVTKPFFEDLSRLSSKLLHDVNGTVHARIKTMKMAGAVSQGYLVPLSSVGAPADIPLDADLTDILGVLKYEKDEEKERNNGTVGGKSGTTALGFPKFVPKTDQNRVQNISHLYNKARDEGELFEKSFKLDGSSLTAFIKDGVLGVASRNVGFRMQEEKIGLLDAIKNYFRGKGWKRIIKKDDNAFTQMAETAGVADALQEFYKNTGRNIAIQGEMVGPSIQKNFEGVTQNEFYIYDIFDIDAQKYLLPEERQKLVAEYGLNHVPLGSTHAVTLPVDVETAIKDADGPSGLNGKYREGFVYKSMTRDFSFKVISNAYLLKEE